MKKIIIVVLFLSFAVPCFGHRVCIEKSTGKLLEYQSGKVDDNINVSHVSEEQIDVYIDTIKFERLNSLKQNWINMGYKKEDLIVKEITDVEWLALKETWIDAPARVEKETKDTEIAIKTEELKIKFGWTDDDIEKLKEILKW